VRPCYYEEERQGVSGDQLDAGIEAGDEFLADLFGIEPHLTCEAVGVAGKSIVALPEDQPRAWSGRTPTTFHDAYSGT
jgi:hypothetical protein